jgi:hypothetical protein
MYKAIDGAWLLGGGATEGDAEAEAEADDEVGEADGDCEEVPDETPGLEGLLGEAGTEAEAAAVTEIDVSAVELQ